MYPYLQYTKVYAKVQARNRLQLELFRTDPFEGTRDVQRGCTRIFVASRDSNLDISGCQGRDRGPLPNSFQHLRFANSAVNTEKVGGNIVKFYQRRGDESWPSLQGGERGGKGHSEFWRETACDRVIGPTLSALSDKRTEKCRVEEISGDRSSDSKATFVLGEISSPRPVASTWYFDVSRSMIYFAQNRSFVRVPS